MILYPTETIYGLGVNPFDGAEIEALFALKGRDATKAVSWLVRDSVDIERYAIVSDAAQNIINTYLPGPVTVVLPARPEYEKASLQDDKTLSFRISVDPIAQKLVAVFMDQQDAPLTCTSANVSGEPTMATPAAILEQFSSHGKDVSGIEVVDDGARSGQGSTVVRVVGDAVEILRQGSVVIEQS